MRDEQPPLFLFFRKQFNSIQRRVTGRKTYWDAQNFTATDEVGGKLQADLLLGEGCSPSAHVLEIGCGCLSAGAFLIQRLDAAHYVGIDPNEWLREVALQRPEVLAKVSGKDPVFLSNFEFDASSTGRKFDFVLSHSILSHAAHEQLALFLKNTAKVLAPSGKIYASLILAEGNAYGNSGSKDRKDSLDAEWVYPGVSYFTLDTVHRMASEAGLKAEYRPDLTEWFTQVRPMEHHDWFMFSHQS